jgi:biotin carboxylase
MLTILCVATYFKGGDFLEECRRAGCTVLLLTSDALAGAAWPHHAIDEIHTIPRDADEARVRRAVDAIARRHRIARIVALDDFDVEIAAMLREHMQVPGIGRTTASRFRDKLAMRMKARGLGIPVPEFTPLFNDQEVNEWVARVPRPWVLKPRSSAAAIGIKKVSDSDELWRALDAAADERFACVLERFVPGDVYHVDSIVWDGHVVFAVAFKYGRPPMQIAHDGGLFVTRRLPDDSDEGRSLLDLNKRLQDGLGLRRGVSHSEFIRVTAEDAKDAEDLNVAGLAPARPQEYVFLETSARVGGAFIVDTIEAATGINLWREWARIEIAGEGGAYEVPPHRRDYAGIVLSLARQEEPDMSAYTDPEIKTTIRKRHHAGLIVGSPDPQRVEDLLADYSGRFYRDFFATAPPPERPVE